MSPANSPVHRMYQGMVDSGKDKGKAARIAQAKTHTALATGRPPKKKPPKKKNPPAAPWKAG